MRTHPGKKGRTLATGIELLSEESGDEILRQRGPGAVDPLAAVVGIFSDDALTPAINALAMHSDEKDAAVVQTMEARLEKVDERHVDFAQRDGFDFHVFKEIRTTKVHEGIPWCAFVSFVVQGFSDAYDHFSSQRPSKNLPSPSASRS